jgi:hypothetical protein
MIPLKEAKGQRWLWGKFGSRTGEIMPIMQYYQRTKSLFRKSHFIEN